MSRTPLFRVFRQTLKRASKNDLLHLNDSDREAELSRRDFLSRGIGVAALAAHTFGTVGCQSSPRPRNPASRSSSLLGNTKITVIGAGLAGLTAAHYLEKSGYEAQIFEASGRVGGRTRSVKGLLHTDLTTEVGGEFIDSNHTDILRLVSQLDLELLDFKGPSELALKPFLFNFENQMYTESQTIAELSPLISRMKIDIEKLPGEISYLTVDPIAKMFDRMSISQYLDSIGAKGWCRKLIEIAYVTEYGRETDNQSALNLLTLVGTDYSDGHLHPYGKSDEQYTIASGNESIAVNLARNLNTRIQYEHELVRIGQNANQTYYLDFKTAGATRSIQSDIVVIAIPLTVLRNVEIKVDLPDKQLEAIRNISYGSNSKVMVGYKQPFWREAGFAGEIFTDQKYQCAWDSSRLRKAGNSSITFFMGGKQASALSDANFISNARQFQSHYEHCLKSSTALRTNKSAFGDWNSNPFSRGSYAAYSPGHWTKYSGLERASFGQLYFAGEHCSSEFMGFMNGAVESGRVAAEAVLRASRAKKQAS